MKPALAQTEYEPGELFFKISDNAEVEIETFNEPEKSGAWNIDSKFSPLIEKYSITSIQKPFHLKDVKLQKTYLLKFSKIEAAEELIREIQSFDFIEYVEQVPRYQLNLTPNDLHPNQWDLSKILAEQAWNVSTGSGNVVVALVDDAVLLSHEDLSSSIWTNLNEIPGNNIDDDGNGYVDDINGYDVADNDNDPNPPTVNPGNHTHGTHCAGIIAATTNNSIGIASIGFGIKIMPVKVRGAGTPPPYLTNPYSGVQYAIAARANVISMSWGGGGYSATYQNLFNYAHSLGIVMVAAAGNSNSNIIHYPAGYNHVISVGATDNNDQKASFSNYGSWVDVMAPGKNIWSTLSSSNSSYGYLSGTSMACPLVAGLCGLMLSFAPGMSPDDIETCLKNNCDNIDAQNPGYIGQIGAGRINAYQSLICLSLPPVVDFTADFLQACPNQNIQFTDLSAGSPATSWLWSFPGGTPSTSTLQNPVVSYPTAGTYNVTLTAANAYGSGTLTKSAYIKVSLPTAVISGTTTIIQGTSTYLIVNLTGTPPWSITYSDGSNTQTINGINSSPYFFQVTPDSSTTYNLISMSDGFCAGTVSGGATINVVPPAFSSECLYANTYGDAGNFTFREASYDPVNDVIYVSGKWINGSAIVLKLDRLGNTLWAKQINGLVVGNSRVVNTVATNNEVLVSIPTSDDFLILRMDANGNILWSKKYGTSVRERLPRLVKSIGDTYLVGAWHEGSGDDALVLKIDGSGNVLWSKRYNTSDDQMGYFTSDGNGGCLMSGDIISSGSYINVFMGNIDANGNSLWLKRLNTTIGQNSFGIRRTHDDGYLINGSIGSHWSNMTEGYLVKLNSALNIQWTSRFDMVIADNSINKMTEVVVDKDDGSYIPFKIFSSGVYKAAVIKHDQNGNFIWAKSFDYALNGSTDIINLFNATSTPIDNFIMIGNSTTAPGVLAGTDGFVSILDTAMSNCISTPISPNHYFDNWTLSAWNPTVSNVNLTVTNMALTTSDVPYVKNELCTSCNDSCYIIASISASDSIICLGDTIMFHSDSIAPLYEWKINGMTFSSSRDTLYVFNTAGNYLITLLVSDSLCSEVDSILIIVNDLPEVSAYSDTSICAGSSVQLLATGGGQYAWWPTNGLINPFIANPIASPSDTTIYHVIVTDSNGCMGEDSLTIATSFCCNSRAAFIASDSFLCEGDSVLFSNLSITTGAVSFQWYFGSGAVPPFSILQNPPIVNYPDGGVYDVILILTDSCGMDTATFTINVYNLPIADAGNDTSVCILDTLHYQLGETPISYYVYSWSPTSGLPDPSIADPIASAANSITYHLLVVDAASGCSANDSVTIFIDHPVDSLVNGAEDICLGDSLTLWVLSADSVKWSTGDTSLAITIHPVADTTIWVSAYSGICISQDTVFISVTNCCTVEADFSLPDSIGCAEQEILLQNQTNASTSAIYLWNFGPDATPSTSNQFNPSPIFYHRSGNFEIKLLVTDTCGKDSISHTVYIFDTPQPQAGNDTFLCAEAMVTLGQAPIAGHVYHWSPSTGLSDVNLSDPFAFVTAGTIYYLHETDTISGCQGIDSVSVQLNNPHQFSITGNERICIGNSILLSVNAGDSLIWSTGDTGRRMTFYPIKDSVFSVIVFSSICSYQDSLRVSVDTIPVLLFDGDSLVCSGKPSMIRAAGALEYTWSTGESGAVVQPAPEMTTTFYLTGYNGACSAEDSFKVEVQTCECEGIVVPNAFTPNDDGPNDLMYAFAKDDYSQLISFKIFNRWGEMVFETNNINIPWDGKFQGKKQNSGVFVYYLTYVCKGEKFEDFGSLTLIR